jgi:dUTPase
MYARSSLPTKTGLMVANSVAVFDADYRGEYLGQLYNFTSDNVEIPAFTRLMQLEFFPYLSEQGSFGSQHIPALEMVVDPEMYQVFAENYPSERGIGGIGSTG